MKFWLSLAAFFIMPGLKVSGQTELPAYSIRCTYKYEYQPDSTDPKSRKNELMLLLIEKERSYFLAWNSFMYDSVSFANRDKINNTAFGMSTARQYYTETDYKISKTADSIYFRKNIRQTIFRYSEPRTVLQWTIHEEQQTIAGLPCQKATAHFSGRTWIAWFAPSIPLQDGPYKFCNLPGLVVRVSDSQNYFAFTLESFENINTTVNSLPLASGYTIEKTDKKRFLNYQEKYRTNRFEMDQAQGVVFVSGGEEIRKNIEENARKNNNVIERLE